MSDRIWLVTILQYDLGYFDDETCRLEPIETLGPKVLPLTSVFGMICDPSLRNRPDSTGGEAGIRMR